MTPKKKLYQILSPCSLCAKWYMAQGFHDYPLCDGCKRREAERKAAYLRKFDLNLAGETIPRRRLRETQ